MVSRLLIFVAFTLVPGLGWIFAHNMQARLSVWIYLGLWVLFFAMMAVAAEGEVLGRWQRPFNIALAALLVVTLALPAFYSQW